MSKPKILFILLTCVFLYGLFFFIKNEIDYYQSIGNSTTSYRPLENFIYPFILLFELFGLLQLWFSKFKKTTLLRIYLQYDILLWIVSLPTNIYFRFFYTNQYSGYKSAMSEGHSLRTSLFFILSLFIIALYMYSLLVFEKELKPVLKPQDDGTTVFSPVTRWNRFFHRFFDVGIFSFIVFQASNSYRVFFLFGYGDNMLGSFVRNYLSDIFGLYMLVFFLALLYYFITEVIFNTTIGKTILGNIIINENGERASVGQRVGRTFCRFIPFDQLSFLFGYRGWHDSITRTYVVKAEKS